MKITKLILKNFAPIYSAMKVKQIEIDFSKGMNELTLFVGPNGSGKTAVLSTLHPFAYSGSFDTRSEKELILSEEDGYKEIQYHAYDSFFIIKHFYSKSKTGRTVKSFITKDGEELNANGNVSSFKELVHEELGIHEDYMRLVRLGPNVINFADMKTAERKTYVTDLMSEIDVYSKYYKKINDDNRYLKNNLSNVVKKLERLHIVDLKEEEKELSSFKKQEKEVSEQLMKLQYSLGQCNSKITSYTNGDESTYLSNFKRLKEELEVITKETNKITHWIASNAHLIDKKVSKGINKVMERLLKERATKESTITANLTLLNSLYMTKENRESQLKIMKSEDEIKELKKKKIEYENRLKEIALMPKFQKDGYGCSKDDMLLALSLLQEIERIVQDIYEYGSKAVKEVVRLLNSNINIENYIAKRVTSIDEKVGKLEIKKGYENEGVLVLYVPTNCATENCPYYNRYHSDKDKKGIKDEIRKLENDRDFYISLLNISKKIDYIFMMIRTNQSLICKLPENYFSLKELIVNIGNLANIYNEEKITDKISEIELYDEYCHITTLLKEIEKEIGYIKSSSIGISTLREELNETIKKINAINEANNSYQEELASLDIELKEKQLIQMVNEEYKDKTLELNELTARQSNLDEKVNLYVKQISEIRELRVKSKEIERDILMTQRNKENLSNQIKTIEFRIHEFHDLSKEVDQINKKFEDIKYIRSSLSSNEGIPLLFVQLYFQQTKKIVNDLLEIVYHGEIEIGDFEIDESSFNVPFYRNSIRIGDIKNASQGERNFFSLALSFALMIQTQSDYNIMLLDEIDGPFDKENREKFITILEAQIKSINAEQVFLISHNNTFDNYALNVLEFGPHDDLDSSKNITQLHIKKAP